MKKLVFMSVCVPPPQSQHNMTAPNWVSLDVMKKLQKLKDFGFQVKAVVPSQLSFKVSDLSTDIY